MFVRVGYFIRGAASRSTGDNSIYTDGKEARASTHGHSVKQGPSVQDKILAVSSVAFGVIGFVVFLCFYCSPLIKARQKNKAARKRQTLLKPFLTSLSRLPGNTSGLSTLNSEKYLHLEAPRPIVVRDSFGIARARQEYSSFDLNRILSRFPSPPQTNLPSSYTYPQSPFSAIYQSQSHESLLSSPSPTLCSTIVHERAPPSDSPSGSVYHPNSSFVGSPSLQSLTPILVVSSSQESLIGGRDIVSSSSVITPSAAGGGCAGVLPTNPTRSLSPRTPSSNRVCGMVPPRSSSLASALSARSFSSTKNNQDNISGLPHAHKAGVNSDSKYLSCSYDPHASQPPTESDSSGGSRHPPSPVYADVILPHYLRTTPQTPPPVQLQIHSQYGHAQTQTQVRTQATLPQFQSQASEGTKATRIQSLRVRDSVFARASKYAHGLVSSSSGPRRGTELQFEIVKNDSVLHW